MFTHTNTEGCLFGTWVGKPEMVLDITEPFPSLPFPSLWLQREDSCRLCILLLC